MMSICQVLLCEKDESILYLEKKVLPNNQEFNFRRSVLDVSNAELKQYLRYMYL